MQSAPRGQLWFAVSASLSDIGFSVLAKFAAARSRRFTSLQRRAKSQPQLQVLMNTLTLVQLRGFLSQMRHHEESLFCKTWKDNDVLLLQTCGFPR